MNTYAILLRGVNVGGKNILPMAALVTCLEGLGFSRVRSFIASGNIILQSDKSAAEVQELIEAVLPKEFKLTSERIRVLVLSQKQLRAIVSNKPAGFGEQPSTYHSDVIFLLDIPVAEALNIFDPREGVDTIWPGAGVIYSQRLSALRTKSRLNKVMGTPAYQSMTIRTWNTTKKLLDILEEIGRL